MVEFDLVAKVRADTRDLINQLKKMPAVEVKTKVKGMGSDIRESFKSFQADWKKALAPLVAIAGTMAIYAKASPLLSKSIDRLTKVILLFFKPLGDIFGQVLNKVALGLREVQKGRATATKELGPGQTTAAEVGGAAIGGIAGGIAGAKIGGAVGAVGGPAGALAGGAIGAGLGFFLGPQILAGIEDALGKAGDAIKDFIKLNRALFQPFFQPLIDAANQAISYIQSTFIDPITSEVGQLIDVFAGIFSQIYDSVSSWIGKAWDFVNSKFITPIVDGLTNLASAFLETATAWAKYIFDNFIDPVLKKFQEWYAEITEKIIKPIVEWMRTNVIDPLVKAWEGLAESVKGVWDGIFSYIQGIYDKIRPIIDAIKGVVSGAGSAIGGGLNAAADAVRSAKPPGKQVGGDIPETGLYLMHRGEHVSRASEGSSRVIYLYPSISITGNTISSEIDLDLIADKVTKNVMNEISRLGK